MKDYPITIEKIRPFFQSVAAVSKICPAHWTIADVIRYLLSNPKVREALRK